MSNALRETKRRIVRAVPPCTVAVLAMGLSGRDRTLFRCLVRLDGAALLAREVFESPASRVERVVERNPRVAVDALDLRGLSMRLASGILQASMKRWLVVHDNRAPSGNRHLDADVKVAPVVLVPMRPVEQHPAAHDAGIELFQPGHALLDVGFECIRMRQSTERDLSGDEGHGLLLLRANPQVRQ